MQRLFLLGDLSKRFRRRPRAIPLKRRGISLNYPKLNSKHLVISPPYRRWTWCLWSKPCCSSSTSKSINSLRITYPCKNFRLITNFKQGLSTQGSESLSRLCMSNKKISRTRRKKLNSQSYGCEKTSEN